MLESTDRNRFAPRQPLPFPRPQLDMGVDKFQQPTQVAPPMEPPAAPQLRSVLDGKREQEQQSEENIRRLIEQLNLRSKQRFGPPPGMPGR